MGRKILIADDESHILNVLLLKLRHAGFDVVSASDGGEALESARRERPDLLITDYHMPVLTGVEVCQRLREDAAWKVPAILLTARGNELTAEELVSGGIVDVINKPFSPRHVLTIVSKHLDAA